MGRVYEAEHVEIGKRVAVKVLHPAYTRTPDVVERFRREARAASKIYHPNIVNVTDSGTTDEGAFFFVMEYIEGVELGYVIHRETTLAPARVLHIAEQVCHALQAAHDVGVIHRDLKPENILLVTPPSRSGDDSDAPATSPPPTIPSDVVKVLDFGIAKSADIEESGSNVGRRLTRPGVAMGTPEYMAPEQAAGKPADPRSDIYAVGSIMYEMLVGVPPYDGDNVMEVLHKKANEAPQPVRALRPDVPADVEALVDRAMARAPDSRPQSMRAFAEEIRAVAMRLAVAAPDGPAESHPRRESPLFAAAIDGPASLAAVRVSRRSVAAGSALLALLGGFVIVRAAMVRRERTPSPSTELPRRQPPPEPPLPAVTPLPSPEPPPLPPVEVAAPAPAPRPARLPGINPASAREVIRTAQSLLKAQRYDEAAEAFRRVLSVRRERGAALVGLGAIAFQQRKYDEAVSRAKEAARGGGGIEARLLLGDAYFKLEKYDEAKKAYDDALRLDPASDTARRGLELASRRLN